MIDIILHQIANLYLVGDYLTLCQLLLCYALGTAPTQ